MKSEEKGLSAWHLTMMSLGSVIGGSFFLGTSIAVHVAGPAIILAYIIGGALVYFILFALSEMTVANPRSGSFQGFASNAFGQGAGFVVGWVYWTGMSLSMSSEAIAISILIRQWKPNISIGLLGSLIVIGVTLINLLGARQLSKLESGLASIKVFAIISFIVIALALIFGLYPGKGALGLGAVATEPFLQGGIKGLAGSMLIVMFSYAGFEVIGFAASETSDPDKTVPRAIRNTVFSLVGLYILTFIVLLPLIPTIKLSEKSSYMVAALTQHGIGWAGFVINIILVSAILSTMLASMFGLGRMIRSLCDAKLAPKFLNDDSDVPYRGILASGLAMLMGVGIALLFPRVYLFLVSAGGFSLLFTYVSIVLSHIKFRKANGCPPSGKCQLWGFPYTSYIVLAFLLISMISMPFVSGQGPGLVAGLLLIAFYIASYFVMRFYLKRKSGNFVRGRALYSTEASEEISEVNNNNNPKDENTEN